MFRNGNVKRLEVQPKCCRTQCLQKLLRLCSLGPKIVPFRKQHFPQTTVSICYALSAHKAHKLAGKFVNLLECLTFWGNKAHLGSLHGPGILERRGVGSLGRGGGGWKSNL